MRNQRIAEAVGKDVLGAEMGKVSRGWAVVKNLWFMWTVRSDLHQKSMC